MKSRKIQRGKMSLAFFLFTLVLVLAVETLGYWVSEREATEAARINSFRDVTVTDKAVWLMGWRGCSAGDNARFTVRATNSQNEKVEFYVCVGLFFKGSTIRTK